MALLVTHIGARDFRSFDDLSLELGEGMTLLVGPNAAGKTNTIEILQLLTTGASFRKPRPAELIRNGAASARCSMVLEGDGRKIDVACEVSEGRRSFARNGKRCHAADLLGTLLSVLFCPDDLTFCKGSASARRAEIDAFGRQASAGYAKVLAAYTHSVEQRNRLLKQDEVDLDLLDAWDESVATGAAALLLARVRLFARLSEHVSSVYAQIADGERLECSYEATIGDISPDASRDDLQTEILARIQAARPIDLRRQQTTVGPHRDDISFEIEGADARAFGSQGQQRSVVLAWKMAEVLLCEEMLGERPLLLLDDVMSELDERRREAVSKFIERGMQAVVTTTNLGYFSEEVLGKAKVIEYGRV